MAGSLLQHVRTDMEPARIWNGVSLGGVFCTQFLTFSFAHFDGSCCVFPQAVSVIGLGGRVRLTVRSGCSPTGPSHVQPGQLQHGRLSNAVSQVWKPREFLLFFSNLVNCFGTKRQGPYSQSFWNGWLLFNNRIIFAVVFPPFIQNSVIHYITMLIHS